MDITYQGNAEDTLIIVTAYGIVGLDLLPDVAPNHVERIKILARNGEYDNVAFHRVIDGFVAQTGDVLFGDLEDGYDETQVGRGESSLPDMARELSDISFERGVVGMARATDPDTANSQFFITTDSATFLDNAYTVFATVLDGMDMVDQLKQGNATTGAVGGVPDRMEDVFVADDLAPGKTAIGSVDDDTMTGGDDAEAFFGFSGKDLIKANGGHDFIAAGNEKDKVLAGGGRDEVLGGAGRDVLLGGSGGDTIEGGAGIDLIRGQGGADVIDGGKGDDSLIGGNGGDTFVFTGRDFGSDIVADFVLGADVLDLRGTGFLPRDVTGVEDGVNTVFTLGDDEAKITLENVTGLLGEEAEIFLV